MDISTMKYLKGINIAWKSALVVFLILLADQILKIWVKTNMCLSESNPLFGKGDWAQIYFIENNGMAFGIEFGGVWGKILLTSFRLVAVIAIGFYIRSLIRKNAHTGLILTLSMIMAGAFGNIIDSVFYGILFESSEYFSPSCTPAAFLPEGGGYAPLFQGRVVDMFYFPIINTDNFTFFKPVFNLADSSITIAVGIILIFQKRFFHHLQKEESGGDDSLAPEKPTSVSEP